MLQSSHVLSLLIISCLQGALVQLAAAAPTTAAGRTTALLLQGATAGAADCSLTIVGFGTGRKGIKSASLACKGGKTITIAAHQELKDFWGKKTLPGVVWGDDDCVTNEQCLLTVCGQSNAVFNGANITALHGGGAKSSWAMAVCVNRGSTVTFRKSSFTSNQEATSLVLHDNTTSVLVDQSVIRDNAFTWGGDTGWTGGVFVEGRLTVVSSTVAANTASGPGAGAIAVQTAGEAHLLNTRFLDNSAKYGGAVNAGDQTRVTIQGCLFQNNKASEEGGAICVSGQAQVEVLAGQAGTGRTTFRNNSAPATCGGDISVGDEAAVNVTAATLTGSTSNGGGSLCVAGNGTVSVVDSIITGARGVSSSGGCVSAEGDALLRLENTVVSGCSTPKGGGGVSVHNQATLELIKSTVSNNNAGKRGTIDTEANVHGGGVALWDSASMLLEASELSGNYAHYGAGGLNLEGNTTVTFQGDTPTVVRNNTAQTVGGGIRLASGSITQGDLSRFFRVKGNHAKKSPDISVVATSIEVIWSNADNLVASDSRDGFLQVTLNVTGANGMPSSDDLTYSLFDSSNASLFDQTVSTGDAELKELAISLKRPPGHYNMLFTNGFWSECSCATNLSVTIVKCPKGHVTGGRDDTCNRCPAGLYSFDPTDIQCSICGANTDCSTGGATVFAVPGFWSSAPQSVQMHRCFNPNACLGGAAAASVPNTTASHNKTAGRHLLGTKADSAAAADFKTAQCAGPYEGNLCGNCKPGYGRVRPFLCRKCLSTGAILVLYMLAAVAMIGLVKLLVYFTTSADLVERTDLLTPTPAELLRALVIHSQWLYILSMMVGVPWPATLSYPLQIVGGIWSSTSGSSIGFDCILRARRGLPVAIQKLLICLFTPAGILCGVLAIEAGMHYLRSRVGPRRRKSARAGHDFASVVMCIVFMFLPTWVNTALSLFTCVPLDDPVSPPYQAEAVGSWWVENMSMRCWHSSSAHRAWALGLGIPLTLLFCVALPAGAFVFMWVCRKRSLLHDLNFKQHYGFMYRLWRDEWCWWEAIVLVQTCALVLVATFGWSLGGYYQCLLAATVLAIVGMLLLAVKPFKCPAAGRVAVVSVCILFFTAQAALSFIPNNSITPGPVYTNTVGAAILVANVAFFLGTIWKLVRVVDWVFVKQFLQQSGCCRGKANMPSPSASGPPGEEKDPAVLPQ